MSHKQWKNTMETIQATVNPRLLTKANRLFTGTLHGRVIEILQNARRAGATKVEIENDDGFVTVHDNGRGIEDFARLAKWVDASGVYYGSYWGRRLLEYRDHPNFRPAPTFSEALSTVNPLPVDKR